MSAVKNAPPSDTQKPSDVLSVITMNGWKNVGAKVHAIVRNTDSNMYSLHSLRLDNTDFKMVHITVSSKEKEINDKQTFFAKSKYRVLKLNGSDDHGVNSTCMRVLDALHGDLPVVLNVVHTNQILLALQVKQKLGCNPRSNLQASESHINSYYGKDGNIYLQMYIIFNYKD